ncbi:FkbM family methyltransferase [Murinocardiopsis flavida]|uniref:FkbM family methyltransferase n=1 Tax=Murinocardiopsis flavida TaxID=645275 RepID=UPI001FEA3BF6|nr:FkbM family methyltransferase [Murinocardiopsis flavida]
MLLSRRNSPRVESVSTKTWLVSHGKGKKRSAERADAAVKKFAIAQGMRVHQLGGGAQLVVSGAADKVQAPVERAASQYLGRQHAAALLRHYQVNCVFDVGANIGQYAKHLRRDGYTGRIVSFEPVQKILEQLREAAKDDPDWLVYPCALGREATSTEMNVVFGSMSSLLGPSEYGSTRYKRFAKTRTQEIQVRRLDEVMDEALEGIDEPRPYLKLDTQGYDLEAFAGAGTRIKEFVGMQSEVALMQIYEGMPRMAEAVPIYEDAGFEVTGMFPVTREESTGRVLEFDCMMARAESLPNGAVVAPREVG